MKQYFSRARKWYLALALVLIGTVQVGMIANIYWKAWNAMCCERNSEMLLHETRERSPYPWDTGHPDDKTRWRDI